MCYTRSFQTDEKSKKLKLFLFSFLSVAGISEFYDYHQKTCLKCEYFFAVGTENLLWKTQFQLKSVMKLFMNIGKICRSVCRGKNLGAENLEIIFEWTESKNKK